MARFLAGPDATLIDELERCAARHVGGRARIAVAWVREDGAKRLLRALNQRVRLEVVAGLNEGGSSAEGLSRLIEAGAALTVFFKHHRQTYHPKLYLFDDGAQSPSRATVIVGSSNLTRGGLITNFEASLVVDVDSSDPRQWHVFTEAEACWHRLTSYPFAHRIHTVADLEPFYVAGHVRGERELSRVQRRHERQRSRAAGLPTSPPPWVSPVDAPAIDIPFLRIRPLDLQDESRDPASRPPVPHRFFVRTLTPNDVEKLHGRRPGTFEPDLGETARDRFPGFCGWPEKYAVVQRRLRRKEWRTRARLVTAQTNPEGTPISVALWFRDQRAGHAAEHRIGLHPISRVRAVVPGSFDDSSFLVVERAPLGRDYVFVIRLITRDDVAYPDYRTYLRNARPQHTFGYGP